MAKSDKKKSFGDIFAELETITQWFEQGKGDVEEGLEKFEHGVALAQQLKERLATVENRITEIRATFARDASDLTDVETNDTLL